MTRLEKYRRIVEILEAREYHLKQRVRVNKRYNEQLAKQFDNKILKNRIIALSRLIRILDYKANQMQDVICND
jgi:hypothetical protein